MDISTIPVVYVLSDSVGETGELVVKAASSQFNAGRIDIRRIPYLNSTAEVEDALLEAAGADAVVAYTLVRPDLKAFLIKQATAMSIRHVDILGPMMDALGGVTHLPPRNEPGLIRKLDEAYFRRVEAIEFAVKYDDGKESRGLSRADIIITGISRTSKTPLCMYLAHKGIKVANVPLVPEVPLPEELFGITHKIIGLIIQPQQLFEIRKERLRTMGLSPTADYANMNRIYAELEYSAQVMRKLGCPMIDVTNKAVEETAGKVIEFYRRGVKR